LKQRLKLLIEGAVYENRFIELRIWQSLAFWWVRVAAKWFSCANASIFAVNIKLRFLVSRDLSGFLYRFALGFEYARSPHRTGFTNAPFLSIWDHVL
jgi:hypothetical protein